MMKFYDSTFLVLIAACGILTWQQYRRRGQAAENEALIQRSATLQAKAEASRFAYLFLGVYCLVMGSDWLQGPFIYSLYKDQFGLQERIVGLLFVTGFCSAAVSGYFVGQFADKYGRRTACLIFCVTYSLSCFSTLIPSLPILFLGRFLGGVSTSVMYSAFESWMVTEFHRRQVHQAGTSLSSMFGIMTTLNSIVAILSGIFSEWLVEVTNTKRAPFMASAGLLALSFWIILLYWSENYGNSHKEESTSSPDTMTEATSTTNVLKTVLTDKRILTLGLASCFFEGSMYLFVFFWTPALKYASGLSPSRPPSIDLPLGTIFASFMACVMLGSLLFSLIISNYQLLSPSRLLPLIFLLASASLLTPILSTSSHLIFWSFCIFEFCVGVYFPSIGYLKGKFVDDGVRARVYGVLRVPLNIFVVVALALMREGTAYRNQVFLLCSTLIVFTGLLFRWVVAEEPVGE